MRLGAYIPRAERFNPDGVGPVNRGAGGGTGGTTGGSPQKALHQKQLPQEPPLQEDESMEQGRFTPMSDFADIFGGDAGQVMHSVEGNSDSDDELSLVM